jgi:hypothetical protein
VSVDYECGICGSGDLVITAVVDGWEVACGGGHALVPVPGAVYATSAESRD